MERFIKAKILSIYLDKKVKLLRLSSQTEEKMVERMVKMKFNFLNLWDEVSRIQHSMKRLRKAIHLNHEVIGNNTIEENDFENMNVDKLAEIMHVEHETPPP